MRVDGKAVSSVMKLGIGTAQFGMAYGATNQLGQVSDDDVENILKFGASNGVHLLDTAMAYGESEKIIGNILQQPSFKGMDFQVVTKISSLQSAENLADRVKKYVDETLCNLGIGKLHGLLVHDAGDLLSDWGADLWKILEELKQNDLVTKIGASIYTSDEARKLISLYPLDVIQVPCSIADQRLVFDGTLGELKNKGVEIHARSVFLQGLLLSRVKDLPERLNLFAKPLSRFHKTLEEHGLMPLSACLGFIHSQDFIDRAIVGMTSFSEFKQIIDTYQDLDGKDYSLFAIEDKGLLNPSTWPQ